MTKVNPLRVGIVCYPLIGGSGILATALGTELAGRGHEVHFVSYARPVRLAEGLPGVHFHGVRVNDYALFRYPDYTLPLAVKLASVARAHRLDLFHVHYAVPHATAAFLAVQMLGGPGAPGVPRVVTTLHGTDTNLLGRDPGYRPAIEHALEHSDAITTVSESLRRETLGMFTLTRAAAARVEVIHNFYRPAAPGRDRATVRRELGVGDDEFLAVHLSNLRPGKRIDLLLRALAATRDDAVRLLVLGGGDFKPHAPLLDELGLRGRVVVREDVGSVDEYLAAADVGVSTSELESFGLSLLETLCQGRPVVAFAVGGIPELVTDGVNGFLHPFGDVLGMAASLDRLAASPEETRTMGERGRRDAAERFGPGRIVAEYEGIYWRVLTDPDFQI